VQVDTHLGARPSYISTLMKKLLEETPKKMTINDVAKFHCEYEIIHPFYDGNGRTGRLLMLKHCLQNNIQPFYIEEFNKKEYYLGIEYYQTTNRIDVITKYFINQQNRFFEKYSSKTKEYVV
jgi:Fic family protein